MALTEERKGQIALLGMRQVLRDKGIRLTPQYRRELGNFAKEIGVPFAEVNELVGEIVRQLVDETFKGGSGKEPAE